MRNVCDADFPRAAARKRGDVVAGDRLVGRRDQRLHFLVFVRRDAVDVLGSKLIFQPLGAGTRQFDLVAGAVPVLVMTTGTEVSAPADALRAEQTLAAGDVDLWLAGDLEREVGGGRGILGRDFRR